MTKKQPKNPLAWRIEIENRTSLDAGFRARSCGDYEKAAAIARHMARDAKKPVLMKSRTHTLRVSPDGEMEQLEPRRTA